MAKEIGKDKFGSFYTGGKVRSRREWRGVKDTLYDYSRWLYIMAQLGKFMVKPRNVKGFFRYRWMSNYLAVPMMVDRHTQGLRGPNTCASCHEEQDLIIDDVAQAPGQICSGATATSEMTRNSPRKSYSLDENEMTAVMMGFPTLKGLSRETPSTYVSVLLNQHAAEHYIDVAQEFGLAGDVCPMPETEAGISIADDFPVLGACAVQCNTTCDGSLLGNGVISSVSKRKTAFRSSSLRRRCVTEQMTCRIMRHRKSGTRSHSLKNTPARSGTGRPTLNAAKRVDYATKCRQEWLEMNRTDYPQVFGSNLALYTETNYMAICGKDPGSFRKSGPQDHEDSPARHLKRKKMAAKEYRHRAIIWGVQSHFYMDFLVWLLNCWGIVPLTDMLSMVNTRIFAETDTPENREQAYYDMAWLNENMIMRNRTHGGYKVLLDELWEFCEEFNADMVILWEHMSCKALDGMHGLFEERARETRHSADLGQPRSV